MLSIKKRIFGVEIALNLRNKIRLPNAFDNDLQLLLYSMATRRFELGFLFLVRSIYFSLLGYNYTEIGILLISHPSNCCPPSCFRDVK